MVSRIKKLLILFKSYFSEKEDTDFLRIDKGIGDKILFSPVYIMLIILLFSNATWYEMAFFWILFAIILIPEVCGRYILVSDKKIIQRQAYIHRKELAICEIKKCYVRYGLYPREKGIDRGGYAVLRLETEKSFMNISMFYYRRKELIALCEKIGFPNTIKRK